MSEFDNKVVVITGAGSGIGRITAIRFAQEGGRVVVSDISEEGGNETVSMIHEEGGLAHFIKADAGNQSEVENLMKRTVEKFSKLDIGVNNAGIGGSPSKFADDNHENWKNVMQVNTFGVFYCMKYQLQQMLRQGSGSIVNISSIAGLRGLPSNGAYSASKHAVVGMTKTAAMEYARSNIRVNAVCPVFTITNLFNPKVFDNFSPGLAEKLKAGIPMKRFGRAVEIAEAILWLCSSKASFVTGHAMPIDGGLTS